MNEFELSEAADLLLKEHTRNPKSPICREASMLRKLRYQRGFVLGAPKSSSWLAISYLRKRHFIEVMASAGLSMREREALILRISGEKLADIGKLHSSTKQAAAKILSRATSKIARASLRHPMHGLFDVYAWEVARGTKPVSARKKRRSNK